MSLQEDLGPHRLLGTRSQKPTACLREIVAPQATR